MRLLTRKLISPELTRHGDNSRDHAPDQLQSEAERNASAAAAANNSGAAMANRDAPINSVAFG